MRRGVIFDMDGTMFDTERIYRTFWLSMARDFGEEPNEALPGALCGMQGEDLHNVIRSFYPNIDAVAYHKAVRAAVDDALTKAIPEKPYLHELVDYLLENQYSLALASSSTRKRITHCLSLSHLTEAFPVIVSGAEIEHSKPAPDIFLMTADKLGLSPSECYVIEDGLNGVYAGIAAGCRTIMVPDLLAPDARAYEGCVGIYENLLAVRDALAEGKI